MQARVEFLEQIGFGYDKVEENKVNVRIRGVQEQESMDVEAFINKIADEAKAPC